ncbi:hypothetical protein GCM10009841_08670 [Microlunatus panaciterrae]|uniref:Methionine-rich copper-binding protein CopC n=1 Tax=Microlunatus panaciterrae TaxID=400768 RepID=A0ABS2RL69_9ACTN|nr:hypothetical protein [Microlunatus panaciterrae]MBM7799413.1 methionine-rich copper-binding protein CopC [Microlunatus panaciterrae]
MTTPVPSAAGAPGSATPFAVTAPAQLELAADRTGTTTFTVTNLTGRPVTARFRARGGAGADDSWFAVAGASEVPMSLGGTLTTNVTVTVPPSAPAGQHTLQLEVIAEDDTESVSGQTVSFTVGPAPAPARRPRWLLWVVIAAVVLLLAGFAAWFLLLRGPAAPVSSSPPTISGTAQEGQVLTADQGLWEGTDLRLAMQWQRCDPSHRCTDVAAATGLTYTPVAADVGQLVQVRVTASNPAGDETAATSDPVGPVTAAVTPPPQPTDLCVSGFVWRQARAEDHVCVTPETRAQTWADNAAAPGRWVVGAYGVHTCIQGFVWREAFVGDDVCVTGAVRTQAAQDNALAASRVQPPGG